MSSRVAGRKIALLLGVSFASMALSGPALSQDAGFQTTDELIVYGTVVSRNRSDTVAPVLVYDLEYFQRFEPISAGDALKRAPGVSFSGDTLEYDELQLRGLPSIYANVQVNGQSMTGPGSEGVFFVDRIPAELIDSVEIIRSPSADMSSEGIAGTANIKLKQAGTIQGGWVRGSGFAVEGDELRGAGSVGYGDTIGDTSYLVSLDVQQRRNPKEKIAFIYNSDDELEEISTQKDTRDGTDYAFNGEVAQKLGDGLLRLYGLYAYTDREEKEFTENFWFEDLDPNPEMPFSNADQTEDIQQQNLSIVGDYKVPVGRDEAQILLGYNLFIDNLNTLENERKFKDIVEDMFGDDILEVGLDEDQALEFTDTKDQDWFGTLAYTLRPNDIVSVKLGVDGRMRTRDFQLLEGEPGDIGVAPNGQFDIEEDRIDPYVKATWNFVPGLTLETGLRYENTWRTVSGDDFDSSSVQFNELNPSAHLRYALTESTMMRLSVARTVLRPTFDQLTPVLLDGEPTNDKATMGNPDLAQETAWGFDAGFDQRLGERGVFGFNFFNRDIKDKIELIGTGAPVGVCGDDSPFGDPADVPPEPNAGACAEFEWRNVGDARAWGIELDLDTPLDVLGLPNTSIFANYTWLNSEFINPLIPGQKIRFRDQPDYIFNVGFIHSIPEWKSRFGATYNKRGESIETAFDEIENLTYDGNLEAFWETQLSKTTVLRFVGANLLDAEKTEHKQFFDPDLNGDPDGREVETEKSGRLFLMTVRQAF
jgi:outer membrane receptor for ferrienterochelin and colicins